jgi:hypothetical protein
MDRSIRMAKSETARQKRKSVKELKEDLQPRQFKKAKHLRKKVQKLNKKHDDNRGS